MVTSVMVPSGPATAVSFGITNPMYDGSFSRSTRATTSSRTFGSKVIPYFSNKALAAR